MLTEEGKNAFAELGQIIYGYAIWILVKFAIGFIDDFVGATTGLIISVLLMIFDMVIVVMVLMRIKRVKDTISAPIFEDVYHFYKFALILSIVEIIVYYLVTWLVWDDIVVWMNNPVIVFNEWLMAYLPEIISGVPGLIKYILLYKVWKLFNEFFVVRRSDFNPMIAAKASDAAKKLSNVAIINAVDLVLNIIIIWFVLLILVDIIAVLIAFILMLIGYFKFGSALKKIPEISERQQPSYGYSPPEPTFSQMGPESTSPESNIDTFDTFDKNEEPGFKSRYRFCPQCGAPNKKQGRFCVQCGFDYSSV